MTYRINVSSAPAPTAPHRPRLRRYLTACYASLIIYASLTPFTGWHYQGLEFSTVLRASPWHTYTLFDATINLLAYFPFGLLLALTYHIYWRAWPALALAAGSGFLLSCSMEYAQLYLPMRTSSNFDLLSNGCGTLLGAALGVSMAHSDWFIRLAHWRHRLFHEGTRIDLGLALISLWAFAQINPSLPMLGNVFISAAAHPLSATPTDHTFHWLDCCSVALNLVMLGMLLLTLIHGRRNALITFLLLLAVVAFAKFIAAAILLKSWALLLWLNGEAIAGLLAGALLFSLGLQLPRNVMLGATALAATVFLLIGMFQLDGNSPASARGLQHWHYGHLLNYNGLSQTLTLLFPPLLLVYLWHIRNEWHAAL